MNLEATNRYNPFRWAYIYALVDPLDGEVRYVGYSRWPTGRYEAHLKDAKILCDAKTRWIAGLLAQGTKPIIIILQKVSYESRYRTEAKWIRHFVRMKCPLVNDACIKASLRTQAITKGPSV